MGNGVGEGQRGNSVRQMDRPPQIMKDLLGHAQDGPCPSGDEDTLKCPDLGGNTCTLNKIGLLCSHLILTITDSEVVPCPPSSPNLGSATSSYKG